MSARKPLTFDIERSPRTPVERPDAAKAEARKQVGARVKEATYRRLKARAAMQGEKVQDLVEEAIEEYLTNHPE